MDGKLMEPVEHLTVDVPEAFIGVVIEKLGARKGEMPKMHNHGYGRVRIEFRVPSRGLIGLRSRIADRHARHDRDEFAVRRLHRMAGRDSASPDRRAGRRPRRPVHCLCSVEPAGARRSCLSALAWKCMKA